jgi:cytochrome c biogenesis protein CcmG/thiol:disulfide interchange protein DsbE
MRFQLLHPTLRFLTAAALALMLLLPAGHLSGAAESRRPRRSKKLTFDRPLPKFQLKDLEGRTWKLSDLKGKVTLINVWATWCAPCRVELPYVQRLHEALENVPGLQVLTLNLDENPALVPGYMRAGGYTFPVIRSFELAEKIHPVSEIPQNWIIDSKGRRSVQSLNGYGEVWLKRVRAEMEKALRGP